MPTVGKMACGGELMRGVRELTRLPPALRLLLQIGQCIRRTRLQVQDEKARRAGGRRRL